MAAGQALLPDLPGPVLSMDIAISVGLNTWVMLITAEWYRGHLERLSVEATGRTLFAAELVGTQEGMVESEDRLRQGLAEFLHGPVQSHLFLAWIRLREGLQTPADLPTALQDANRLLGEVRNAALGRVRDVLEGSVPQDSLEAGTTKLAESYRAVVRIEQHWSPEASALARRLAPENQTLLLQFAEECLLDALRHASPKRIQVGAKVAGDETLRLTVENNGRGFQTHAPGSGLGLKMLGRKLEESGGAWTIRSVPGADTEVTMEISAARTPL